jgi:hypothetical protein
MEGRGLPRWLQGIGTEPRRPVKACMPASLPAAAESRRVLGRRGCTAAVWPGVPARGARAYRGPPPSSTRGPGSRGSELAAPGPAIAARCTERPGSDQGLALGRRLFAGLPRGEVLLTATPRSNSSVGFGYWRTCAPQERWPAAGVGTVPTAQLACGSSPASRCRRSPTSASTSPWRRAPATSTSPRSPRLVTWSTWRGRTSARSVAPTAMAASR